MLAGKENASTLFDRFSACRLPTPVVGELRFGVLNSSRQRENHESVERLIARCHIMIISEVTTAVYAAIRMNLKVSGKPIPENDVWIAALCIQHQVPLATLDRHFDSVPDLLTIRI